MGTEVICTPVPGSAVLRGVGRSGSSVEDLERGGVMTFWRFAAIVRRRWIVAVLGLLATLAGSYLAVSRPGVYYEEATVVFIAPQTVGSPAAFQLGTSSLVSSAGLVGRQVDRESGGPLALSPKASIVDMGTRDGVWVRLPNEGGQWRTNFDREELDVQAVGETPAGVHATMTGTLQRIKTALRQGQLAAGAPRDGLITVAVTPQTIPVIYRRGSTARAGAASLGLGAGLTAVFVVLLDRVATRSRRRRRSGGLPGRWPKGWPRGRPSDERSGPKPVE
jgi:hypothetical protein